MKPTKNRQNLKSKTPDSRQVGDLLHLPSNVRLWKWDDERTIPVDSRITQSPTVALCADGECVGDGWVGMGIRVYCDGEYWWVKESDVFLLEPKLEIEK
jgi:hypothetical protein